MKIVSLIIAILATVSIASGAEPVKGPGGLPPGPQCFPYVYTTQFFAGDLSSMYENQRVCREERMKKYGY